MAKGPWDYEIFWKEVMNQLQGEVSEQEFLMWFRNMGYLGSEESRILLSVPSNFYKDQVTQRYLHRLEGKLFEISGQKLQIQFRIQKREAREEETPRAFSPPLGRPGGQDGARSTSSSTRSTTSTASCGARTTTSPTWPPTPSPRTRARPTTPA